MNTIVRSASTVILSLICAAYITGCTYHTYYGDEDVPAGDYKLKSSTPIAKEKVVERHYVVE